MKAHTCVDGMLNESGPRYAVFDYQQIFLFYACDKCVKEKKSRYRPEVFSGYDQSDMDEPIEPDE